MKECSTWRTIQTQSAIETMIHCVTPEAAPASTLGEITSFRCGPVARPTASKQAGSHCSDCFRLNPGTAGLDDNSSVGFLFTNGHYLPELAFSSRSLSLAESRVGNGDGFVFVHPGLVSVCVSADRCLPSFFSPSTTAFTLTFVTQSEFPSSVSQAGSQARE